LQRSARGANGAQKSARRELTNSITKRRAAKARASLMVYYRIFSD